MRWLRAHVIHLSLFVVGLIGYGVMAGERLGRTSAAPHFVLQADAWLRGEIAIDRPAGDDWVKITTVTLDDGTRVRGRTMTTRRDRFALVGGGTIPTSRIQSRDGETVYMSFPPVPAVLLLPQVAVAGRGAHDVAFAVVFAAAVLPLLFATLTRLRQAGLSRRSDADNVWLTLLFGFGTVFWFAAAQGSVWFAAHVIGVFFAIAYAWASIEARHPVLAGLAFAAAALTRTPMAFMLPLFLLEVWRATGGEPRAALRRFVPVAIPVAAFALAAIAYNLYRFESPTEFGHSFLAVRQQEQIEPYGLFDLRYLSRNLTCAFTLLPELTDKAPFVQISGHGLAIWFTTPTLLLLLWPHARPPIHRALWITVACVAIPTFFYQNSGWVQFGYRFALDYLPFLILLLAVGGRPLRWPARTLILVGIAVNLFGAATFDRRPEYYRLRTSPASANDAYHVITAH